MRRYRFRTECCISRNHLVSVRPIAPAKLPPAGIVGLNPDWSRLVHTPDTDGVGRTWHILDTWNSRTDTAQPALTLLCVHGNPSWSFLWRDLLAQVEQDVGNQVRVIAVDQLDMGFSERTGTKRVLATRVDDLSQLTDTLDLRGQVITVAHDWGGPVSLGWALRHIQTLKGVVLTNTAVHQPAGAAAPALIRLTRLPFVLKNATVNTSAFIKGAIAMSRPKLSAAVSAGFHAPYVERSQRAAIADFVADIPLEPTHESAKALDEIAVGLEQLSDTPSLLLWGPNDKVFSDLYLHDLEQRLPHAAVHRFPTAAHFVTEDANVAKAIIDWTQQLDASSTDKNLQHADRRALADFSIANPETLAVVDSTSGQRSISFGDFNEQITQLAVGMLLHGIQPGARVAVMVTPGVDLCLAVYGCWRLGATVVLVDSGLGRIGMQRALQSANPAFLIGIDKALIAAKVLRWPGKRIAIASRSAIQTRGLNIETDLHTLIHRGKGQAAPAFPTAETVAAIAFTSGSTGPSKGVIYQHHQIQAQRDALMGLYEITSDDRLVAAFAPFALYGPTMGITSIVPDMDVTAPGSLEAHSLADAVKRINATLVFASPAALVNVVATQDTLATTQRAGCSAVRLVLSAGAPVRAKLLESASSIFDSADFHTPYGMTEVLPVADISLSELQQIAADDSAVNALGEGVCVGYPLPDIKVMIDPVNAFGEPTDEPASTAGLMGEIIVQAAHARQGYDRLWHTNHLSSQPAGWHRTGDIGTLDSAGRLWVAGRLGHIITTPSGALAPVDSEQRIETLSGVAMAALVGVGPPGTQVVVAVLQTTSNAHKAGEASLDLSDDVRAVVAEGIDIAAVLVISKLPVDRRHNSKVDRSAVAHWATRTLAGERVASL